jgi:hypothetical protein
MSNALQWRERRPRTLVSYTDDSFVFAPNLGENTSIHSNMHNETVDDRRQND